jgi:predicted dehydrogenase
MKRAKLAIIGCGGLAQSQHIPNMMKIDNAELSIICDLNKDILDKVGDYYGIKRRETDFEKVLRDPDIDGVLIVTREDSHVPLTLQALDSGKHVYVEKPLAETETECAKIVAAQEKCGKIVAVGLNRRMAPAYRYAKELLWKQGGPKNMFYRIADAYSLNWGKKFGEGNRIIHEVCHVFDILRFFTDSEVESLYCLSSRPDDEQIALRFKSGTVATIMSSGYVNSCMPKEHFEAIAQIGGLVIDDFAEVHQYSLDPNSPNSKTFAGHSHPMHDLIHEYLLEELGDEGMRAIRQVSWKALQRIQDLEVAGNTDCAEYRQLKQFENKMPARNYFMDKGWRTALEDFATAILLGRDFQGAKAFDGFQATRITEAAIKSRTTGQLVKL